MLESRSAEGGPEHGPGGNLDRLDRAKAFAMAIAGCACVCRFLIRGMGRRTEATRPRNSTNREGYNEIPPSKCNVCTGRAQRPTVSGLPPALWCTRSACITIGGGVIDSQSLRCPPAALFAWLRPVCTDKQPSNALGSVTGLGRNRLFGSMTASVCNAR